MVIYVYTRKCPGDVQKALDNIQIEGCISATETIVDIATHAIQSVCERKYEFAAPLSTNDKEMLDVMLNDMGYEYTRTE